MRLSAADLDNNGALDLLLSPVPSTSGPTAAGPLIWLGDEKGGFTPLNHPIAPPFVFSAADVSGNGHLDLLGLSAEGQPVQVFTIVHEFIIGRSFVRTPYRQSAISESILSVSAEQEVRSGLLVQKQPVTGPELHFGLGQQTEAEVVRVVLAKRHSARRVWREGRSGRCHRTAAQGVVPLPIRLQRQANGIREGRSSLGLRNRPAHQHHWLAQIATTGEWYRIGRDQLVPHDGYYDIRVTAELWEVITTITCR